MCLIMCCSFARSLCLHPSRRCHHIRHTHHRTHVLTRIDWWTYTRDVAEATGGESISVSQLRRCRTQGAHARVRMPHMWLLISCDLPPFPFPSTFLFAYVLYLLLAISIWLLGAYKPIQTSYIDATRVDLSASWLLCATALLVAIPTTVMAYVHVWYVAWTLDACTCVCSCVHAACNPVHDSHMYVMCAVGTRHSTISLSHNNPH